MGFVTPHSYTFNSMFVRLGTDYEIRNGGYFKTIRNSADQFISKPSKIAPISFGVVAFKWLEWWRTARIALFGGLQAFGEQSSCVIIEWQHFLA